MECEASFRFYAELNDFPGADQRGRDLAHPFDGRPSVKDAIAAQAFPTPGWSSLWPTAIRWDSTISSDAASALPSIRYSRATTWPLSARRSRCWQAVPRQLPQPTPGRRSGRLLPDQQHRFDR